MRKTISLLTAFLLLTCGLHAQVDGFGKKDGGDGEFTGNDPNSSPVVVMSTNITIPNDILFDVGSDELKTDASPELQKVAEAIQLNPGTSVIVEGHTDSQGGDQFNMALSFRRANNVVKALGAMGVDLKRLSAVGHGETRPIGDNNTSSGRQQNRRVEFH